MKQTMKQLLGTIMVLLLGSAIYGQEASRFDYSIYGGVGLSTLKYETIVGRQEMGYGGLIGGGIDLRFSKRWRIGTGAELSLYNARTYLDRLPYKYMTEDMNGGSFEFRSVTNLYEEKQQALFLNIPLMLKYETGWNTNFFGAFGAKLGIPISGKYKINGDNIKTSGYYPYENYEYTDQQFMGFGNFPVSNKSEDVKFDLTYMLSAEVGIKWYLSPSMLLHTGIYADYGMNDAITGERNKQLINYNTPDPKNFMFNSVLTSQYNDNGNVEHIAGKITPLAVGIKIGLTFGKRAKKSVRETTPIVTVVPEQVKKEEPKKEEPKKEEPKEVVQAEVQQPVREVVDTTTRNNVVRREVEREQVQEQRPIIATEPTNVVQSEETKAYLDSLADISMPLVGFLVDGVNIPDLELIEIDKKVEFMKQHPNVHAHFTGYTCNIGNNELNLILGLKRANVVRNYMIGQGIHPSRITTSSKGRADPLVPNNNEFNRRINRRVEFKFTEKK